MMIYLLCFCLGLFAAALLCGFEGVRISVRLWQHIEELEADKRALTESLCRAQGKPYISHEKREFKPSEGWFDGKPRIEVKN